nr:SCO family protein [Paraburkholderia hospita]
MTGQFQLHDADGNARALKDYQGKVVLAIFGYTQCPDVMASAADIRRALGLRGKPSLPGRATAR